MVKKFRFLKDSKFHRFFKASNVARINRYCMLRILKSYDSSPISFRWYESTIQYTSLCQSVPTYSFSMLYRIPNMQTYGNTFPSFWKTYKYLGPPPELIVWIRFIEDSAFQCYFFLVLFAVFLMLNLLK